MSAELQWEMAEVRRARAARAGLESWVGSAGLCALVLGWFLAASPQFAHWFVLPVFGCGVLMGKDAVDWARRRLGALDPAGLMGLLGLHFFFLSPLLTIYYGTGLFWWAFTPPRDWRDWLGYLSVMTFAGLVIYRWGWHIGERWQARRGPTVRWRIDRRRFWVLWPLFVLTSAAFAVVLFRRTGGFEEIAAARALLNPGLRELNPYFGLGWITVPAEQLGSFLWVGFVVYLWGRQGRPPWLLIAAGLVGLFAVQLVVAGPRGSRMGVIFAVIEAVIMAHYALRPVRRRVIVLGLVFVVAFSYFYAFYKVAGQAGIAALTSPTLRAQIAEARHRTVQKVLIDDLSRAGIQSYLLYRLTRPASDYIYSLGRSYVAALLVPVPSAILPNKPRGKNYEGAAALVGRRYAEEGGISVKVLGLAGEAMLNFSPLVIPFAFIVPGLLVGAVRRWLAGWERTDARMLFAGVLVPLVVRVVHGDSSNLSVSFFAYAVTMLPLILLSVRRERVPATDPATNEEPSAC